MKNPKIPPAELFSCLPFASLMLAANKSEPAYPCHSRSSVVLMPPLRGLKNRGESFFPGAYAPRLLNYQPFGLMEFSV